MGIGKAVKRVDAVDKVTGRAKYVEDMVPAGALHVKVLHSTIANGIVKSIDVSDAYKMPGVECIVTCFDVPGTRYATAGHPLALDPDHADIKDKLILESRIRFYGDDIAAVVADTPLNAANAVKKIKVEYEEYPPYLNPEESIGAKHCLNEDFPTNELARMDFRIDKEGKVEFYKGQFSTDEKIAGDDKLKGEKFSVPQIQAAPMENMGCLAYMDGSRLVVVTPNQVPMTLRRNIADALEMSVGNVKVIKPYVGGGFGHKQDTMYEPLAAFLTKKLGGRPVSIQLTREETFVNTRTRHAFDMNMMTKVNNDGIITEKALRINSNGGAYATHNHAVAAYAITNNFQTYVTHGPQVGESSTAYTTRPSAGAMRGYGIPQLAFAMESQMDDIAKEHGWDPVEFRLKNIQPEGFVDPFDKFVVQANALRECIEKGREVSDWDRKRKEYAEFNKTSKYIKKGIGMALFSYKTGVYPLQIENASCRIIMNEDGSCQLQVGATELGQGSDTGFTQMVSEITTIPEEKIYIVSVQDSDVTPYDAGAYASRQGYVTGSAVKQTAQMLVEKLTRHAAAIHNIPQENLKIENESFVEINTQKIIDTIGNVCRYINYVNDLKTKTDHITAESTFTVSNICFSYGVNFADIDVDIMTGRIKINRIWAVHDSGKIINPLNAQGQVRGGVAMAIGYALTEQMLFDEKSGRMINNNLLNYKIPTSMDVPDIEVYFVEHYDPTGPFGNKALGEPPTIPTAPAIRNAVLHATDVAINSLPMNPDRLIKEFTKAQIIPEY